MHKREKIRIPEAIEVVERQKPKARAKDYKPYKPISSGLLDGMPAFGQGHDLLIGGQLHDEAGNRAGDNPEISAALVKRLCEKITRHAAELVDVEKAYVENAETVVVAYGSVARSGATSRASASCRVSTPMVSLRLRMVQPPFFAPSYSAWKNLLVVVFVALIPARRRGRARKW